MKPEDFPKEIRPFILPEHEGELIYRCLGCGLQYGIEELLYTCPDCGQVFLIYDMGPFAAAFLDLASASKMPL